MALPNSGPLSISQIATEFGKPLPCSLRDLYGVAPGIPASGVISVSMFYGKSNTFTFTISASSINPNIRSLAISAGWDSVTPLIVNITAPLINTLDLGTSVFTNGITLNISATTRVGGVGGSPFGGGGFAFKTRVPVRVNNLGVFSGGGGGGGYGCSAYVDYYNNTVSSSGGDGGYGEGFISGTLTIDGRSTGSSASTVTYSGGILGGDTRPWVQGGSGGEGGLWGESGVSGSSSYSAGGSYTRSGIRGNAASGRAAGASVDGMAHITWINQGTLVGPRI